MFAERLSSSKLALHKMNGSVNKRVDSFCDTVSSQDDYQDEGFSYQNADWGTSPATSSSQFASKAMLKSNSDELLHERMTQFESGQEMCMSTPGKCTFVASRGYKIELVVREDVTSFRISTVVLTLNDNNNSVDGEKKKRLPAPYSLLTKMMKHNTILDHVSWGDSAVKSGHIVPHDGRFIFSMIVKVSLLSNQRRFESVLDDFILRAVGIGIDLSRSKDSGNASKLLRRKHLTRAYNNTLL